MQNLEGSVEIQYICLPLPLPLNTLPDGLSTFDSWKRFKHYAILLTPPCCLLKLE